MKIFLGVALFVFIINLFFLIDKPESTSESICSTLGYNFKLAVQNEPQFIGRKVHRSRCTKNREGRLEGYVYEFNNVTNKKSWVQLSVGSTRAIDVSSVNRAIETLINSDKKEVEILIAPDS